MINVIQAPDTAGNPSVCVVLGAEDVFLTTEGIPTPGIALSPSQARELAYSLLLIAERVENAKTS